MLQWSLFVATEVEATALKISYASLGEQTDATKATMEAQRRRR